VQRYARPAVLGEPAIELPLVGGNITSGVVRVGDTVRRPPSASPFIRQLLELLEAVGFAGAPRWLGIDRQGRDVFSFLPGRVAAIDERLSDDQVGGAAALLRVFHNATRGSVLAGERETVCHHDAGPHNMVFADDDIPYALIDFDMAAPGDALEDVSYAAWLCSLNSAWLPCAPVGEQARQLRLFTDSYGLERRRRQRLLSALAAHQLDALCWANRCLADGDARGSVREHAAKLAAGCSREHAFLLENRAALERALR
jgi:hypothetical protein